MASSLLGFDETTTSDQPEPQAATPATPVERPPAAPPPAPPEKKTYSTLPAPSEFKGQAFEQIDGKGQPTGKQYYSDGFAWYERPSGATGGGASQTSPQAPPAKSELSIPPPLPVPARRGAAVPPPVDQPAPSSKGLLGFGEEAGAAAAPEKKGVLTFEESSPPIQGPRQPPPPAWYEGLVGPQKAGPASDFEAEVVPRGEKPPLQQLMQQEQGPQGPQKPAPSFTDVAKRVGGAIAAAPGAIGESIGKGVEAVKGGIRAALAKIPDMPPEIPGVPLEDQPKEGMVRFDTSGMPAVKPGADPVRAAIQSQIDRSQEESTPWNRTQLEMEAVVAHQAMEGRRFPEWAMEASVTSDLGPIEKELRSWGRAAVYGVRQMGAVGAAARAINSVIEPYTSDFTPEGWESGAVQEIDPNSAKQRLIAMAFALGVDAPTIMKGAGQLAAKGMEKLVGSMSEKLVGSLVTSGLKLPEAADLARHFLTENPWIKALVGMATGAAALGTTAAVKETSEQVASGRGLDPGKIALETGKAAVLGGVTFGAAAPVDSGILRYLTQTAGFGTLAPLLIEGRMPTVQDYVEAGVAVGIVEAAAGLTAAAKMAMLRAERQSGWYPDPHAGWNNPRFYIGNEIWDKVYEVFRKRGFSDQQSADMTNRAVYDQVMKIERDAAEARAAQRAEEGAREGREAAARNEAARAERAAAGEPAPPDIRPPAPDIKVAPPKAIAESATPPVTSEEPVAKAPAPPVPASEAPVDQAAGERGAEPPAAASQPEGGPPAGPEEPAPTPPGAVEGTVAKPAPETGERKFASTQVYLPRELAEQVKTWAADNIAPEDLHPTEKVTDEPHVTVKYGLHEDDPAAVAAAIQGIEHTGKPVILGRVTAFTDNPEYDVLKVDILSSKHLKGLNEAIGQLPSTDTHPEYKPHITLAYLKKGTADKYVGTGGLSGLKFTPEGLVFSPAEGEPTTLPLRPAAPEGGGPPSPPKPPPTPPTAPKGPVVEDPAKFLDRVRSGELETTRANAEAFVKLARQPGALGHPQGAPDAVIGGELRSAGFREDIVHDVLAGKKPATAPKPPKPPMAPTKGLADEIAVGDRITADLPDGPVTATVIASEAGNSVVIQTPKGDELVPLEWITAHHPQFPVGTRVTGKSANVPDSPERTGQVVKVTRAGPIVRTDSGAHYVLSPESIRTEAAPPATPKKKPSVPRGTGPTVTPPVTPPAPPAPAPPVAARPRKTPEELAELAKRLRDIAAAGGVQPKPKQTMVIQKMATGPEERPPFWPILLEVGQGLIDAGTDDYGDFAGQLLNLVGPEYDDYIEDAWDALQPGGEAYAGGPGAPPLGDLPPTDVPGAAGPGTTGPGGQPGGQPDQGGGSGPGVSGVGAGPSVGGDAGGVGVSSGGSGPSETTAGEEPTPPGDSAPPHAPAADTTGTNYTITDADGVGEGSAGEKLADNITAIRLLKGIEAEGRLATTAEQSVLVKYVGWGGLQHALDPLTQRYRDQYKELKALLTPEEFAGIELTVLWQHMTSIPIVRSMWDGLHRLGFRGGKALESSAGIGHFVGAQRGDLREPTRFHLVEQDDIAGRIMKLLYPESAVDIAPFEQVRLADNFFDVKIGNVPFGDQKISDRLTRRYADQGLDKQIHDYFFAKGLDKVRPGGIMAIITSTGTLDKQSPAVRTYLAQRADLVAAFRLPDTAFAKNALTRVATDLIFLQKRKTPRTLEEARQQTWTMTDPVTVAVGTGPNRTTEEFPLNRYYHDNPGNLLGVHAVSRTAQGGNRLGLTKAPGQGDESFLDLLRERIAQLPEDIMTPPDSPGTDPAPEVLAPAPTSVKPNAYALVDKDGTILDPRTAPETAKLQQAQVLEVNGPLRMVDVEVNAPKEKRIRAFLKIKASRNDVIRIQLEGGGDAEVEAAQAELNKLYDDYVAEFEYLHEKATTLAIMDDPEWGQVVSLEDWDALREPPLLPAWKMPIFFERTVPYKPFPTASETAFDAMTVSLSQYNRLDWPRMRELLAWKYPPLVMTPTFTPVGPAFVRVDPEVIDKQIRAELGDYIMRNPETGQWEYIEQYLSGNVRQKLDAAIGAHKTSPKEGYDRNVEALKAVQPVDKLPNQVPEQIPGRLGAAWIPVDDVAQFIGDLLNVARTRVDLSRYGVLNLWHVKVGGRSFVRGAEGDILWGTSRINALKLIEHILQQSVPRITDPSPGPGIPRPYNDAETKRALAQMERIKTRFEEWLWEDEDRRTRLTEFYNREYNSLVDRKWDGQYLTFPGKAEHIRLRKHQSGDVVRSLQSGKNLLITRIVGSGKTYTIDGITMETKRMGLASKTVIIQPNHLVPQFTEAFYEMYPGASVLSAKPGDLSPDRRNLFMAQIAAANWDAVVIPMTAFTRISPSPQTVEAYFTEKKEEFRAYLEQLRLDPRRNKVTIKKMMAALIKLDTRMRDKIADIERDHSIFFEDLGIDQLIVDEAHAFKNLFLPTRQSRVAGISSDESQRAFDMHMKTWYINKRNKGRGVVFATGTPISNTLGELYVMLTYLAPDMLKEMGLSVFDAWTSTFGVVESMAEFAPEGRYRMRRRFRRFRGAKELGRMWDQVATPQGTNAELGIPVPKIVRPPRLRPVAPYPSTTAWGPGMPGTTKVLAPMSDFQAWVQNFLLRGVNATQPQGTRRAIVELPIPANVDPEVIKAVRDVFRPRGNPDTSLMLRVTQMGRKNALDPRTIHPLAPENEYGKAAQLARVAWDVYQRTSKEKGTQIVFLDLATPKARKKKKKGAKADWEMTPEQFAKSLEMDVSDPAVMAQVRDVHLTIVLDAINDGKDIPANVIAAMPPEHQERVKEVQEAYKAGLGEDAAPPPAEGREEVETAEEIAQRQAVYGDIKRKLIAQGIPENEIAFIHDAKTPAEKQVMFSAMNQGRLRILLGSTPKMGVGANVQRRLKAIHHMDVPWRPDEIEQRNGRGERQGNMYVKDGIEIYVHIAEGVPGTVAFDTFQWQLQTNKAAPIRGFLNGDRLDTMDDIMNLVQNEQEYLASSANDETIMEKINLEQELLQLTHLERIETEQHRKYRQDLMTLPNWLARQERVLTARKADVALYEANKTAPFSIELQPTEVGAKPETITDKGNADERLKEVVRVAFKFNASRPSVERVGTRLRIGSYRGFSIEAMSPETNIDQLFLVGGTEEARKGGELSEGHMHQVSTASLGGLDQTLRSMPVTVLTAQRDVEATRKEIAVRTDLLAKGPAYAERIREIAARLAEINRGLGIIGTPIGPPPPTQPLRTRGPRQGLQTADPTHDPEGDDGYDDGYDDTDEESDIDMLSKMMIGPGGLPRTPRPRSTVIPGTPRQRLMPGAAVPPGVGATPTTVAGVNLNNLNLKRKDQLIAFMTEGIRRLGAGGLTLQGGFHGPPTYHGHRHRITGNIRQRQITNIDVFAHESGHGLQGPKALNIPDTDLRAFRNEMKALTNVQQVKGPTLSEGFAEFVRLYITGPATAQRVAPTFYPWFEARLAQFPDFETLVHDLRDGVLALRGLPPMERIRHGIAFQRPSPLMERLSKLPAKVRQERRVVEAKYFDRAFALRELAATLDPTGKELAALDDPGKVYSILSSEIYAHGTAFLKEGIVDFATGLVVPGSKSFNDAIRPVAAHQEDYIIYEILRRIKAFERSPIDRYRNAAKNLRELFDIQPLRPPRTQIGLPAAPDEVQGVIADLEQKYPHFPQVLDDLQVWNDGLRQYVVDAGRVPEHALEQLQLAIDVYTPLFRLMEKDGDPDRIRRTVMNTPDPLRRISGKSQRIVLPTLQERVAQTFMMVGSALRNEVFITLKRALGGDLAQKQGIHTGHYMDEVETPIKMTKAVLGEFRKEILKAFEDATTKAGQDPRVLEKIVDELDLNVIVNLFRPNLRNLPNDYFIGYVDGKPEVWQIHDPLMRLALQGLDRTTVASLATTIGWAGTTIAKYAASGLRTSIVHSPDFLVAHLTRETQEAMLQGYLLPPIFRSNLTPEMMERYRMAGAQLFRFISLDRATIQRHLDDLKYDHWYQGGIRRPSRELAHYIGELARPFDELTRKGVFRQHVENPRDVDVARGRRSVDIEAAYQAREAGIDFETEGGSANLAYLESITAFMKPAKLGFYRNINNLRRAMAGINYHQWEPTWVPMPAAGGAGAALPPPPPPPPATPGPPLGQPPGQPPVTPGPPGSRGHWRWERKWRPQWNNRYVKGFLIMGAAMFTAEMASYFLYGNDPRYKALPDDQKNMYFLFMPPGTQRFTDAEWDAMPLEEQLAHLNTWIKIPKPYMPGWVFATFPRQLLEFLDKNDKMTFKKLFVSFYQSSRIEFVPTILRGIGEIIIPGGGYDVFRQRAIESRSLQNLPVWERAYPGTSELYRAVSKRLPEGLGMSPVKLEHLVNSYFAYAGQYGSDAGDYIVRALEGKQKPMKPSSLWAEQYVVRRFAQAFPGHRLAAVDEFYQEYKHVMEGHASKLKARKDNEPEPLENTAILGVMIGAARDLTANRQAQQRLQRTPQGTEGMDPREMRRQLNLLLLDELRVSNKALRDVQALKAQELKGAVTETR